MTKLQGQLTAKGSRAEWANATWALSALIVLLLLFGGRWASSSGWVGSSDFHSCIEISGSFIALMAAMACLVFYFVNRNRYYLILGMGFLVSGSEDLIHGILSFDRLFAGGGPDFYRIVVSASVVGRPSLAIAVLLAAYVKRRVRPVVGVKRETALYLAVAMSLAAGMTVAALLIHPDYLLSRPVDFLSALLFAYALWLVLIRFRCRRDTFTGSLLICMLLNLGGGIYMAFSRQRFDVFFDVAHIANLLGYCRAGSRHPPP